MEVGIKIKSKETSKYVASHLAKKLLTTHSTGILRYYLHLFMQTQFQLDSYIYVCTNEIFSGKHTKVNPGINIQSTNQPKYLGIKSCINIW